MLFVGMLYFLVAFAFTTKLLRRATSFLSFPSLDHLFWIRIRISSMKERVIQPFSIFMLEEMENFFVLKMMMILC